MNRRALVLVSHMSKKLAQIGVNLLARFVTKTTVVPLTTCKDVSGQTFAAEKAVRRWLGVIRLSLQRRFKQWPTSTNPMAVASIH